MPPFFVTRDFNKLLRAANNPSLDRRERQQALEKASKMIDRAGKSADRSLTQASSDLKKASQAFNKAFSSLSSNVDTAEQFVSDTLARVTGRLSDKDHAAVNKIMEEAKEEARFYQIKQKLDALPKVPTHDPSLSRGKKDAQEAHPPIKKQAPPPSSNTSNKGVGHNPHLSPSKSTPNVQPSAKATTVKVHPTPTATNQRSPAPSTAKPSKTGYFTQPHQKPLSPEARRVQQIKRAREALKEKYEKFRGGAGAKEINSLFSELNTTRNRFRELNKALRDTLAPNNDKPTPRGPKR